jgi:hypothetical protein
MTLPQRVIRIALSLLLAGALTASLEARGSGSHRSGHSSGSNAGKSIGTHTSKATKPKRAKSESTSTVATGIARDRHGRIAGSEAAKHEFEVRTGDPHGRPGYVVDHVKPLACGGADVPSNRHWQTIAEAKAKDRVEGAGCRCAPRAGRDGQIDQRV